MTEAYDIAAVRHFQDGMLLKHERRACNADQLFGFAAECAIKMALHGAGVFSGQHLEHIPRLWDLAPLHGLQKRFPALVVLLRTQGSPFQDWSTDQRYMADGAVSPEALERHCAAAKRILGSVQLVGGRRGE